MTNLRQLTSAREVGAAIAWSQAELINYGHALEAENDRLRTLHAEQARQLVAARDSLSEGSSIAHDHYQPQIDDGICEINRLRAALAAIQLHAGNTLSTASRDVDDWVDDVAKIAGIAIKAQEAAK